MPKPDTAQKPLTPCMKITSLTAQEMHSIIAALGIAEGHWTTKGNNRNLGRSKRAEAFLFADEFRALLDTLSIELDDDAIIASSLL